MTEQEWLKATNTEHVLVVACRMSSHRKHRLFACGCCRTFWNLLGGEERRAIETSEHYADGGRTKQDLKAAVDVLPPTWRKSDGRGWIARAVYYASRPLTDGIVRRVRGSEASIVLDALSKTEKPVGISLIRCVFGNPFRHITVDPSWLTWHDGLLVSMARQMYDSRDFSDLPVLADALEEAGCTNQKMLLHCRQQGAVHVRGCWVVDLLLGKE